MKTAQIPAQEPHTDTFAVVGIGASAAGIESTTTLLEHLPVDTGMAFVVVQHLNPQSESALAQLLARATSMPVHEATEDAELAPNNVYVIAPDTRLSIEGDELKVTPRPVGDEQHRAIDLFFESLAAERRERAIGVVLAGESSDGSVGLNKIKAEGGVTFAQDDSRSAIEAGPVDFTGSTADIARELVRVARHSYVAGAHVVPPDASRAGGPHGPQEVDDTTERTLIAEALAESERNMRHMLDAIPAAVYKSDANGRTSHFNAACVALSGRIPRVGVDGWSDVWTLFHPDGTPVAPTDGPMSLALSKDGKMRPSEYIVERPDGSRVWCEIYPSAQYDEDGRLLGGVNMVVDITHVREAAAALQQREAREQALFEAAPLALFVCARDGVIQTYNQHAADLWGCEPRRGVDRYTERVQLRNEQGEPVPHGDRQLNRALATGEPQKCGNVYIERPDGSLLPVMGSIAALKNADGEVMGAIASFVDVTDHKRIEQELLHADRKKNEFIAMLAHELRNPLTPIRNALEILRPVVAAQGQTTPRDAMAMLDRQVSQMVRLVDDLLDVNRLTTGRIDLRRERVNLGVFVENEMRSLQPAFQAKNQTLSIRVPAEPVFVDADPIRLSQMLDNLIHNANKFTDHDGRIDVTVEVDGDSNEAVIRVKDTGIGLAANELPGIFELFAQADASRRRSAGGLGIGLALVRDLVSLHASQVSAHSEGKALGSEFVVRLPRLGTPTSERPRPVKFDSTTPFPSIRARRVLVVDDNEDAAESLALLLEAKGYVTRAAFDGFEGLAAVDEFKPDVVFLDIGMPKLDGLEVARRLRAKYPDSGLRIVALTGWGQADDRERTAQAGFDAHMVKPVAFATLAAWLKENV